MALRTRITRFKFHRYQLRANSADLRLQLTKVTHIMIYLAMQDCAGLHLPVHFSLVGVHACRNMYMYIICAIHVDFMLKVLPFSAQLRAVSVQD